MLHVTCTRGTFELATTPSALGAGRGREYEVSVDNITRTHLRMRASNRLGFCDNAEGFARMCLIYLEPLFHGLDQLLDHLVLHCTDEYYVPKKLSEI